MPQLHLQKFFDSLSRMERQSIIEEAGLSQKILSPEKVDVRLAPQPILTAILRRFRMPDESLAYFLNELNLKVGPGYIPDNVDVILDFPKEGAGMSIGHVAAASILVWNVSVRCAQILQELNLDSDRLAAPSVVELKPGSVSLSLGGPTLLIAGVGFVIASYAHLPTLQGAENQVYWGGAALVAVGMTDLALNWWRMLKEGKKFESEAELNIVNAMRTQLEINEKLPNAPQLPVASGMIPIEQAEAERRRFGVPEPVATHLLNEVVPVIHDLRLSAESPSIRVSEKSGGSSSGKSASA